MTVEKGLYLVWQGRLLTMAMLGASTPVVGELVTFSALTNVHSGAATKTGISLAPRSLQIREVGCRNFLRRRAKFSNRTQFKGLVSSRE